MRKLSRYILREYISFLGYAILAFAVIYILVDLVDNLDNFIDNNYSAGLIVLWYLFELPFIVVLTLPVAMLLATMFGLGRLAGDNEITAMKSSGISLYRILLPVLGFAFFTGFVIMIFAETVVPRTNQFRKEIEELGPTYTFSLTRMHESDRSRVFITDGPRVIYAANYKADTQTARDVFVIEPFYSGTPAPGDSVNVGIRTRIDAAFMRYEDGMWTLYNATVRDFGADGESLTRYSTMPAPYIDSKPSDFATIDMDPSEMDYFQLRDYIRSVEEKGGDASAWLVDLYLKISFPFVSFVIVFLGAPLAAGTSRRGKTAAFGIALMISFVFYSLVNVSQVLGRNEVFNPYLAAWLPNIAFLAVGFVMLYKARK